MTGATSTRAVLDRSWPGRGWLPLVLPLALAAVQAIGTHFAERGQPDRTPVDALGLALLLAGPAALVLRDRWPVLVAWAVMAVTLAYLLLGYPYGPVLLSPVVALYVAVSSGHRAAAWLAGAALYGGHFSLRYVIHGEGPTWPQLLGVGAWLLVVLIGSEALRVRRQQSLEVERARQEESRRRASEERLRIARELHDVLAHHISLINVQASVGLHLMERRPAQARVALEAIEAASREAMGELRSVLTILQQPEEHPPRAPAPSLQRLPRLTAQAAATGLQVRTEVEGAPRALPAPVDAAAFRIVQESLTNVVRHAAANNAVVRIQYGERDVTIQVEDDGRGAAADSRHWSPQGGSGIAGMRERVAALGGQFEAGALLDRGFRIRARLPVTPSS